MRSKFHCPYGWTNVWRRPPVHGSERIPSPKGRAAHPNQKPMDQMEVIIRTSSDEGDAVWEPFGGLFTASIAAYKLRRRAFAVEAAPTYYSMGLKRVQNSMLQLAFSIGELSPPG